MKPGRRVTGAWVAVGLLAASCGMVGCDDGFDPTVRYACDPSRGGADCISGFFCDPVARACVPTGQRARSDVGAPTACALPRQSYHDYFEPKGCGWASEELDRIQTATHTYATLDGVELKLDVAWPKAQGTYAVMALFHDEDSHEALSWALSVLASNDLVVVSVGFRLVASGSLFPVGVQDARCAIRWLKAYAADFHGDPERVLAVGESFEGGYLAAMLGAAAEDTGLDHPGCGLAEHDPSVDGVILLSAPTDLRDSAMEDETSIRFIQKSLLGDAASDADRARASPVTHLDPTDAPVLMFHATGDSTVPVGQSGAYAAALSDHCIPHTYVEYAGPSFSPFLGSHDCTGTDGVDYCAQVTCTALTVFVPGLAKL